MWSPAKFIDDNVAFSRMPNYWELEDVASEFNAIVVLVEDFEIPYSSDEWKKRGVDVLHTPIPDFTAPSPSQLLEILGWINERSRKEEKVLIHCMGGCGRSGTIAVAWLMYSKGTPLREALRRIRSLRPCAVETEGQLRILKELEKFLKK